MEVYGYKCFNKNLINRYGQKFEIGQTYITTGKLKFGNDGNGFHLCKNIEDTFRYFDTTNKDICVCEVIGSGEIISATDEFYGYYDLYCAEKIQIVKVLTREELIKEGLKLNFHRAQRFVSTLSLSEEEIELFKTKFWKDKEVLMAINYYQENDKEIYNRQFKKIK